MADKPFLTDIQTLRARARQHIEDGAVTPGYTADRTTVLRLLIEGDSLLDMIKEDLVAERIAIDSPIRRCAC